MSSSLPPIPHCFGMQEHPEASLERSKLSSLIDSPGDPLSTHLTLGLAYTVGSALGSTPPSIDACLAAFTVPNSVGLTTGARAWSKHAHRASAPQSPAPTSSPTPSDGPERASTAKSAPPPSGWWGTAAGPVVVQNERAVTLFWRVMDNATWRNLHWLPHQVLVYEVRVAEGYGMRWSQDRSLLEDSEGAGPSQPDPDWIFRGFVEPMMDGGHQVRWRH